MAAAASATPSGAGRGEASRISRVSVISYLLHMVGAARRIDYTAAVSDANEAAIRPAECSG